MEDEKQATKPQRRRSARKQLEDIIKQFDDCLASQDLKDSKRADVVIEKAGVLKTLLQVEIDEKHDDTLVENQRLQEQHAADTATIDNLKSQVAQLESNEVKTVTVTDPETARVKELNAALDSVLKVLASRITSEDGKAQMAVRVMQSCPESAARLFLPMLGLDYVEYARLMLNYKTDRELLDIVEKAVNGDGPLSRFARARLAVNHHTAVAARPSQPFVPDRRSAEEKLAEARAMTRQSSMFSNVRPQPKRREAGEDYRERVDREMFEGAISSAYPPTDDLLD